MSRYEAAKERKLKILEIIRSLDLPNNPLDDIIDQVSSELCKHLTISVDEKPFFNKSHC